MAKKTAVGGMDFGGDPGKWLALAGLLISLGVLPRKWKGPAHCGRHRASGCGVTSASLAGRAVPGAMSPGRLPSSACPMTCRSGWSIRKFVRTARGYRTIEIQAGDQKITAADSLPRDIHEALSRIHHDPAAHQLSQLGFQAVQRGARGKGPGWVEPDRRSRIADVAVVPDRVHVAARATRQQRPPAVRQVTQHHIGGHLAQGEPLGGQLPGERQQVEGISTHRLWQVSPVGQVAEIVVDQPHTGAASQLPVAIAAPHAPWTDRTAPCPEPAAATRRVTFAARPLRPIMQMAEVIPGPLATASAMHGGGGHPPEPWAGLADRGGLPTRREAAAAGPGRPAGAGAPDAAGYPRARGYPHCAVDCCTWRKPAPRRSR